MDEPTKTLLLNLAMNPQEMAAFLSDRESYLDRAGLGAAAREAILAGDQERVAAILGADGARHTANYQEQINDKTRKPKGDKKNGSKKPGPKRPKSKYTG